MGARAPTLISLAAGLGVRDANFFQEQQPAPSWQMPCWTQDVKRLFLGGKQKCQGAMWFGGGREIQINFALTLRCFRGPWLQALRKLQESIFRSMRCAAWSSQTPCRQSAPQPINIAPVWALPGLKKQKRSRSHHGLQFRALKYRFAEFCRAADPEYNCVVLTVGLVLRARDRPRKQKLHAFNPCTFGGFLRTKEGPAKLAEWCWMSFLRRGWVFRHEFFLFAVRVPLRARNFSG